MAAHCQRWKFVPVIKNADQLNLVGMAKAVNDLEEPQEN
jgi:pyruvate/2-oxoglutarate dehydrogenase complex dihydrolipoamide acyltransferase (E2) component